MRDAMTDDPRNSGRQRLVRAMRPGASRANVVWRCCSPCSASPRSSRCGPTTPTPTTPGRGGRIWSSCSTRWTRRPAAQAEISDLQQTQRDLQSSADANQVALDEARRQVETWASWPGTLPAVGQGVRITIDDPSGAVGSSTLVNAIEELRDAGAEAIELNDRVRVVAARRPWSMPTTA